MNPTQRLCPEGTSENSPARSSVLGIHDKKIASPVGTFSRSYGTSLRGCLKSCFLRRRRKEKVARRETSGIKRINFRALKERNRTSAAPPAREIFSALFQTFHVWLLSFCRFAAQTKLLRQLLNNLNATPALKLLGYYRKSLRDKLVSLKRISIFITCIVFALVCLLSSCKFFSSNTNQTNTQPSPTPKPITSRPGVYFPPVPSSLNRTQSSEHFRAHFSSRTKQEDVKATLQTLEEARNKMAQRLSAISINIDDVPTCVIIIHDSTGNFTSDTKQSWQVGAVTRGISITIQPVDVLRKRNSFQTILRHEFVHVVVNALRQKNIPRWMNEGTALYYSGEGAGLLKTVKNIKISTDELEKKLDVSPSSDEMRQLYAASFREVSAIISKEGEAGLWKQITSQ